MPATEAQRRAIRKYNSTNTRQIGLNFSFKYDADILAKLDSVPNKQGYIKELIRADIVRSAQNTTAQTYHIKPEYCFEKMSMENQKPMTKKIEELLQTPYWIIDILPKQVPKDSLGQYFVIEKNLREEQMKNIRQKHANVILKLNCYREIELDGEKNPKPVRIAEAINERVTYIIADGAMILSEPDDTHMTIFNPDEELLGLVKELAASEGLFVWKP